MEINLALGIETSHPGQSASACPFRMMVPAAFTSSSINRYACSITGDHCPSEGCNPWRAEIVGEKLPHSQADSAEQRS